jgi:hypothetical protein
MSSKEKKQGKLFLTPFEDGRRATCLREEKVLTWKMKNRPRISLDLRHQKTILFCVSKRDCDSTTAARKKREKHFLGGHLSETYRGKECLRSEGSQRPNTVS